MDFNQNLLPDSVSKYKVSNATMDANKIVLHSDASVSTALLKESLSYTPEYFKVYLKFRTPLDLDSYEPHMYVRLTVTYDDDTRQVIIAWINKDTVVEDDFYVCDTNVLVGQKEIKVYEWALLTEYIQEDIEVVKWELRASVDISSALNEAITRQLPSIIFFSNSNLLSIKQSEVIGLNGSLQTSGATNLLLHLIISGTASVDTTLTLSVQMNNKEAPYCPLKTKVQAGDFTVGVPGSVLQVPSGNNQFIVILSSSAGEIKINPNHLYSTLDGKNIIGGYSAEVPHAEVIQYIHYVDIKGNYDVEGEVGPIIFEPQLGPVQSQAMRFVDISKMFSFNILPAVELITVAVEECYYDDTGTQYEHDEYIVLDGNMRFKDSAIIERFTLDSHESTGDIFSYTLDNTSIKKYEAFSIVPKTTIVSNLPYNFVDENFEHDNFILVSTGLAISTLDTLIDKTFVDIDEGKICTVSYDASKYREVKTIE